MTNRLIQSIYFGTELEKLQVGTETSFDLIDMFVAPDQPRSAAETRSQLVEMTTNFAQARYKGRFGGQITAGDMVFITAFIAVIRPATMIELGVCSGQSSASILLAADQLGLLRNAETFLHSFDIVQFFGEERLPVGQVVPLNFPARMANWALHTHQTVMQLAENTHPAARDIARTSPVLAFVDAEHRHPWPLIDVAVLSRLLPPDSWIILHDIRVMERWLANSIERGVPCPPPQRGVTLVMENWPGTKLSGAGMCYNTGAIKNDIDSTQHRAFVELCLRYPSELSEGERDDAAAILDNILRR